MRRRAAVGCSVWFAVQYDVHGATLRAVHNLPLCQLGLTPVTVLASRNVIHGTLGVLQVATSLVAKDSNELHLAITANERQQLSLILYSVRQNSLKEPTASSTCPTGVHIANAKDEP
jgi:hypothetical protein